MTKDYVYSDLDSGLATKYTGDFEVLYDSEVIIQSIKSIFATIRGERVRNPIGSVLIRLLFEPMNQDTANSIKSIIHSSVTKYEPRIESVSVNVVPDYENDTYNVNMVCRVAKLTRAVQFNTKLKSMYS